MDERRIQLVVARPDGPGRLRVSLTIDGKTSAFTLAPHVAVSAIAALADSLAKLGIDKPSDL